MITPTARTLQELKRRGFLRDKTEYWNDYAKIRKDLFGFIDVVYIEPGRGLVAVQATTGSNLSARVEKIKTECSEAARAWLAAGCAIEAWGWRPLKVNRLGKAIRWQPDIRRIEEV